MSNKTLYIIRGVPGSGKSTLAHQLTKNVVETDDFMMVDGEYKYDKDKVYACHKKCYNKVLDYMAHGVTPIAVANTFIKKKDYKPYVDLAKEFGYDVEIKVCKGDYKNVHNVPQDRVEQMKSKFQESINSLLEINGDVGITEVIENKKQSVRIKVDESNNFLSKNVKFVTSPSQLLSILKSQNGAYRILYDKNLDIYMIGHEEEVIHQDMLEYAYKSGLYYNMEEFIESLGAFQNYIETGVSGGWDANDNEIDSYLYYMIFDPYNEWKIGDDGYDNLYKLKFGNLLTRMCDIKEIPLYNLLVSKKEINESLYDVFDPNQIKSVNNGNWSTTSNKINESKEIKLNDNFKKWFGNSKVVDENGNPLVCYHGSPNTFEIFDENYFGLNNIKGFWFSNDKKVGEHYKQKFGKLYSCYIRLENPYILKTPDMSDEERFKRTHIFRSDKNPRAKLACEDLKKEGYDGILSKDNDGYIEVVAFYPKQIKSVNNNGNWSLEVDNINEEKEVIEERLFPELSDRKYNELLWFTTPNMTANAYTKFFGKEMIADRIPAKYLVTLSSNDISLKDLVEKHRKLYNAKQVKPIADYKDFNDFITDLNKSKYLSRNDKSNIAKSGAKIIKSFGDWDLYDITTWEAAKKYGSGTTWCVTDSTSDDYFKRYTNRLPFNNYQTEEDMKKSIRSLLFLINPNTDRKMAISVFKMMDYDWYNDSIDFYDEGDETFYRCSHTSKGSISSKDDIMEKISYYGDDWPDADVVEDYGVTEDFINSVNQFIKDMYRMNKEQIVEDINKFRQKYKHLMNIKESANNSTNHSINEVLKLSGTNLTEGIVDVAKNFPKLDIETIKSLINLDPTYNGGEQLGKYSKWILNLYNKVVKDKLAYEKWEEQKKLGNNFPEPMRKSTDKQEDFEKIPNLLKQFNVLNNKLKTNIDQITSISELYKVVHDAKDKGLSDNSKVQKGIDLFKKSVEKGGEVVFKNSNWVILVPKTLKSSVVFGKDTNWCTTSPNGEMYYHYLKEYGGQYFINLNLKSGDLYQIHFESKQFMNSNDKNVNINDIIKDDSVIKFYLNYLYNNIKDDKKINPTLLPIILEIDNNPPEQVQLMAVQQEGWTIKHIKNPSEQVQMEAVKQEGWAIKHIKNPSEQVQMEAVKQEGWSIQFIKNPSEEVQLIAVKQNGWSIQFIKTPSEQVQMEAVKEDYRSIQYIDNPTEKVQLMAVKQNGRSIQYIKNPTEKVKEYVHMKIHKSTNHSINEEINEVLKLAGVTFKQDNIRKMVIESSHRLNDDNHNMTWEEFVEKVGRINEFDGSVLISKYNTSIIIKQSGIILIRIGKNPYRKAYSNLKTFDEIYNMLVEKGFVEEQILTEAVNQHSLYHGCDLAYAVSMMIDNAMRGETIANINGKKYQGNSLTRSLQFAKDWQEDRWDGYGDELNQFWVVLELNKERLKTKYKIFPYNYWEEYFGQDYEHTFDRNGYGNQYEEFVVGRINNLMNYMDDVYLSDECFDVEYAEIFAIVKRELELRGENYTDSQIVKALQVLGIDKPTPNNFDSEKLDENYGGMIVEL